MLLIIEHITHTVKMADVSPCPTCSEKRCAQPHGARCGTISQRATVRRVVLITCCVVAGDGVLFTHRQENKQGERT